MNMHHRADFRFVLLRSVKIMVHRQEVACGQVVHPLDQQSLAAASFNGRARKSGIVTPHPGGRQVAMYLGADLASSQSGSKAHVVLGLAWNISKPDALRDGRHGQGIDELRQRFRIERRWLSVMPPVWRNIEAPHTGARCI